MANYKKDDVVKKIINTYVDEKVIEKLDLICKKVGRNRSNLLRNLITEYVNNYQLDNVANDETITKG